MGKIATKFKVNARSGVTLYNTTESRSERIDVNKEANIADYDLKTIIALASNGLMGVNKETKKKIVQYSPSIEMIDGDLPMSNEASASKKMQEAKSRKK